MSTNSIKNRKLSYGTVKVLIMFSEVGWSGTANFHC
jgi:hypothetical protein